MSDEINPEEMPLDQIVNLLAKEYDEICYARHVEGEKKYGAGTWLTIDTIQHALDEVADLGNYARFTYVKLRMLQIKIGEFQADGSTAKARTDYNGPLVKGGMPDE